MNAGGAAGAGIPNTEGASGVNGDGGVPNARPFPNGEDAGELPAEAGWELPSPSVPNTDVLAVGVLGELGVADAFEPKKLPGCDAVCRAPNGLLDWEGGVPKAGADGPAADPEDALAVRALSGAAGCDEGMAKGDAAWVVLAGVPNGDEDAALDPKTPAWPALGSKMRASELVDSETLPSQAETTHVPAGDLMVIPCITRSLCMSGIAHAGAHSPCSSNPDTGSLRNTSPDKFQSPASGLMDVGECRLRANVSAMSCNPLTKVMIPEC